MLRRRRERFVREVLLGIEVGGGRQGVGGLVGLPNLLDRKVAEAAHATLNGHANGGQYFFGQRAVLGQVEGADSEAEWCHGEYCERGHGYGGTYAGHTDLPRDMR